MSCKLDCVTPQAEVPPWSSMPRLGPSSTFPEAVADPRAPWLIPEQACTTREQRGSGPHTWKMLQGQQHWPTETSGSHVGQSPMNGVVTTSGNKGVLVRHPVFPLKYLPPNCRRQANQQSRVP